MLLEDYSKPAIQSHKGLKSWWSSANFRNILIKIDGMAKALFRLFHASRDAGVAG
jgi:hypothetical protein